jgi:Holliday junction resolvasome RuvABC endonuclease subunit
MITIGIDPGKSGGIAWIIDGKPCVEKLPETLMDRWNLFESIASEVPMIYRQTETIAYIEQVHSSPQMGVKSAFSFGQTFGHLEMALTAANIPFKRVRPQEWQKAMKCLTGGNKNVSKARAQEIFPSLRITHATADALLIAEFGRSQNAK